MSTPRDIDFALEQVKKARDALDQALGGYGADARMEQGAMALESAFHATERAVREVKGDRDHFAPDPEIEWRGKRIDEAEEIRARRG